MGILLVLLYAQRRDLKAADTRVRAILDGEGVADSVHHRDAQYWKGQLDRAADRVFCAESAANVAFDYEAAGVPTTLLPDPRDPPVIPDMPAPAPLAASCR